MNITWNIQNVQSGDLNFMSPLLVSRMTMRTALVNEPDSVKFI